MGMEEIYVSINEVLTHSFISIIFSKVVFVSPKVYRFGLVLPHHQECIISSLINGLVCNKTDSDHMLLGRVDLVEVKHLRVVNYVQIDVYNRPASHPC